MKWTHLVPLAAASSAIVLPSEEVLASIPVDVHRDQSDHAAWYDDAVAHKDAAVEELQGYYSQAKETGKDAWASIMSSYHNALDEAYEYGSDVVETAGDKIHDTAFDVQSWLEETTKEAAQAFDDPHHRPPHHPHHPKDPHGPHKPHNPHHQPNLTVYQLIAGSKYTTKLAKLINEYDDLVSALNSTKANFTVFAPTDKAFEKIPDHAPKPSKEFLAKLLAYHVVPGVYPAGRVLASHTAPTLFNSSSLGKVARPQRIAFKIGLRGLTVNFYSRIVAINIFGTNGVIHGVDSIIVPPPPAIAAIDLFPGEFSTLELGLAKTGLLEKLNTTKHAGGTLFAPSNFAFQKLGPKINAFLFSKYGTKYLKALLEYHVVPEHTLYSDAYYDASEDKTSEELFAPTSVPKGYFHYDLPTLLKDRRLAVDIARYGRFISMKINAFSRVTVQDGIVADGVIHVVGDVLIPPKTSSDGAAESGNVWMGEDMSVEDLISRLEPFVAKGDL